MLNLSPSQRELKSLGVLAYVDDMRREEIGRMNTMQRKSALKTIEKQLDKERKAVAKKPKAASVYRPVTELERILINKLQAVKYPYGNSHAKFVEQIADAKEITDNQASYIKGLANTYRRQLG